MLFTAAGGDGRVLRCTERLRLSVTKLLFLTAPNTSSVFERRMKNSGEQVRVRRTDKEILAGKEVYEKLRNGLKWSTSDQNALLLYYGNVGLRLMRASLHLTQC